MALPTYSTGTVSVAAGGTVVTGVGGMWSGINAKQGDFLNINNVATVLITEVTDTTHLKITPWPGAAQSAVPYVIYQNYVGRVVGVAAAEDVGDMLEMLHVDGLPFIVGPSETVPDPSYGDDGQLAFKPDTGEWWTKTAGAWVSSPGYGADASKVLKAGDTMTGTLVIEPPINTTDPGIDVTQIGQGTGTSTNNFGYAYNHFYVLSQKIDVSGQVAPIANGLLVDIYPRTGHVGHAVAIQGAVLIPSSTVINEETDHVGVLGYCNLSASHGGTNPTTGSKGAGFGGHFFVVGNATNLFGIAGVEIDVVTETGSSLSRRTALSLCSIGSQVQGSQYDVALNISSGAGVGWLNGISFSAFNGSHPMDATNGKLFTTIGAANVHSGIDISSYTYSGSAFKSTGFNVNGSGVIDADSVSLKGALTLSSAAGATPYVFFKNAAGTNTFISGGGGATPDNTNYFQNNKNVFRTITATDYGTIDATGATLAQSASVPAGGTAGLGLKLSAFANFGVFFGSGAPTLAAAQGSLYMRTDGSSASTRMYVNTNGSTGWTNVVTAT